MIRVAIAGIHGRMGTTLAELVGVNPEFSLVGGVVRPGSPTINIVAKRWVRYPIVDQIDDVLGAADVLIDLSTPDATMHHALACVRAGRGIVVATRGLDPNHIAELREYSNRIPVLYAPDLCVETAVVRSVLPGLLSRLPDMCVETRDNCPAEVIALATPSSHETRLGNQTANHVTVFSSPDQEIVLHHRVFSLDVHARGALRAAALVAGRSHGFYTMDDLIHTAAAITRAEPATAVYGESSAASLSGNGG